MILQVKDQKIKFVECEELVAGSVNVYTAEFAFDSSWDEYDKVAVFEGLGDTGEVVRRETVITSCKALVPWETLLPHGYLRVGVYGIKGEQCLPTIYTTRLFVAQGAESSEPAGEPTPGVIDQVLAKTAEDRAAAQAAAGRAEDAAIRQPYPNGETGTWWVWDAEAGAYADTGISYGGSGGGTTDHTKLTGRNAADQHPMSAITGLVDALAGKQPVGEYLTQETDPTVPSWAKEAQKPGYTASEVGADPSGTAESKVSAHNTGTDTHSDIRLLIQGLTDRLNALADSDDTTLDQLSEVVAYIKSNRDLISSITTDKVGVSDIIDNLTTNVTDKPLSAAQGVALKALIDAITIPEKLPNPNALTFTGAASGTYDGSAPLEVVIPSGGGGEVNADMELLGEIDCSEVSGDIVFTGLNNLTEIYIISEAVQNSNESTESGYAIIINDISITKNQAVTISKSGTTSYGWLYLRYNGCVWVPIKSAGANAKDNYGLNYQNTCAPFNLVEGVGKAQALKLLAPLSQYQAVSGTIKIYGR